MDDLLGEDWQRPSKPNNATPLPTASAFAANYSSLRASPQLGNSGRASPADLSRPSSAINASRPSTTDSFGGLLSLKPQKATIAQSMLERQKQASEDKKRLDQQQAQLWETLGSGTSTPEIRRPSPAVPDDEDDILAAFNKDAPVNKATNFAPPPSSGRASGISTPAIVAAPVNEMSNTFDDDDDPFGLSRVPLKSNGHAKAPVTVLSIDEDDILGDLGRPVAQKSVSKEAVGLDSRTLSAPGPDSGSKPADRALAELVDMGFPPDKARMALSENGNDVQAAVGWLLQQAHAESKLKTRSETQRGRSPQPSEEASVNGEAAPAWARRNGHTGEKPAARGSATAIKSHGDLDPTQAAQQIGTKLFKSANALWKASQKQMAKTIAEFQQDDDPNHPKWMREPATQEPTHNGKRRQPQVIPTNVTDEAAMLDAPRERPAKPSRPSAATQSVERPSRNGLHADAVPIGQAQKSKPTQQIPAVIDKRPASKLSRQDVEDQTAAAYISPARRKKPIPKPEPEPEPAVDLFSPAPIKPQAAPSSTVASARTSQTTPISRSTPTPVRSTVTPRSIPQLSASALTTSTTHRKAGGEHFKRGDYAAAHESYTSALTPLPATHPIAIIVLSNRALTALKTGDAKVAVASADRALEIIGPGLGNGENIDLGAGEGPKDMKEFYGKALMRKAEALEHMEKYADAAAVWRQAVEAGVGGALSISGRQRCEKAAAPKPAGATAVASKPSRSTASSVGKAAPPAKSLSNSLQRPVITSPSSAEAVKKLRAANAEAERADDERFALSDSVDAKLTAWRGGKTDNLRALLQSMDVVLWEEAGWKKIGMSDLVIASKVKIIYMKAIGKVHPDKIPQNATTEQRMISAAVFATLIEAWDKFKTENNL